MEIFNIQPEIREWLFSITGFLLGAIFVLSIQVSAVIMRRKANQGDILWPLLIGCFLLFAIVILTVCHNVLR